MKGQRLNAPLSLSTLGWKNPDMQAIYDKLATKVTMKRKIFTVVVTMIAIGCGAIATPTDSDPKPAFSHPIALGLDDKPAFSAPPPDFKTQKEGTPRGTLEMIEYESKSVGTKRRMQVYLPPGYSKNIKYPVLWLLHGIGGDETEWQRIANVNVLMDNLIAEKKAVPMIVVMPNGRARKNDRAEGDLYAAAPAFAAFERDLFEDAIPAIDKRFSTRADREYRALAGLSMGGGQTLNFGLSHLDVFASLGAFSAAPNTKAPETLVADPAAATKQLRYFLLTCGNKDGLINVSQGMHSYLKQARIPHTWHVDDHGHDAAHWSASLYYFAQHIFPQEKVTAAVLSKKTLRSAFSGVFSLGVALNTSQVSGQNVVEGDLAARQFSSITPENDMKWQSIHPQLDRFDFKRADYYVDFARKHDMQVVGHTLIWHSQTPSWVFQGENGVPATRELLLGRMRDHIRAVMGRYKGKVKGWDVVNEALSDGGPDILRDTPWKRIIGEDFLDQAFRFAKEADPGAELYYNDYGLENDRKRANCVKMLQGLLARGVPIDGVGTQSHFALNYPPIGSIEKTITDLASLGLKVMVTELDIDVLPVRGAVGIADIGRHEQGDDSTDPYVGKFPEEMQMKLAKRYADIFEIYLRQKKWVTRVTFWGLDDGQTWLNNFPIQGRTNHPLLFDRALKPKPAFDAVLEKAGSNGKPENPQVPSVRP